MEMMIVVAAKIVFVTLVVVFTTLQVWALKR
jgi:hypothetical protein